MQNTTSERMNDRFLAEYSSGDAILKYSPATAGYGVNYLVEHDYARVYEEALAECASSLVKPLRILEFGCGAGMNLIRLVNRLERRGVAIERAYGTDFSKSLIESARTDARATLSPSGVRNVSFHIAKNERLCADLADSAGVPQSALEGTFDLIVGVNTFRYCHRLGAALDCAGDIFRLQRPGGVCVIIDMNDRFPAFRSHLRRSGEPVEETYLPSLEEYAEPFVRAGFDLQRKDHFCWIPHSAGPVLTAVCRALTPLLNATIRSRAMRALVIAKRPA